MAGINETAIRDRLVERGEALLRAQGQKLIQFANVEAADILLNDLTASPHAFVLACIMHRMITAKRAWLIPHQISERLGGFSMEKLVRLSQKEVKDLMSRPKPLHRFVDKMSNSFHAGVQRIATRYAGDAARIWTGKPPSAEVVYRFLEFDGVGQKIANMSTNILVRHFKIPFADYFSIDISADRQVRRVFGRLGLCAPGATVEEIIYKARALHPAFPGIMDSPTWRIGRDWCGVNRLDCDACYMKDLCPTASKSR